MADLGGKGSRCVKLEKLHNAVSQRAAFVTDV
jgi:hypothetical protein